MFRKTLDQAKRGVLTIAEVLPFVVRIIWGAGSWLLVPLLVVLTLSSITPIAVVWVGKYVLDSIVAAVQAGWHSEETLLVYQWLGLQLLAVLAGEVLDRASSLLTGIMGKRLSLSMSQQLLEKASSLDLATFEEPDSCDKITRARAESRGAPLHLVQKLQGAMSCAITFCAVGVLIATLDPPLLVAMILVCVPLLVVLIKYSEKQYRVQYGRTEELRKTNYLSNIMTSAQYVREIIPLGLWPVLMHKWVHTSHAFYRQDAQLIARQNVAQLLAHVAIITSQIGATGYILFLGMNVTPLSVGEVMMYSGAFAQALQSVRQGVEYISGIYEDMLFIAGLVEFHKLEPRLHIERRAQSVPDEIESVEVRNVSFRYPGSQCDVLRNVSITFTKSASTLLVGHNGAGKTTLIKLLMRLYDPDEGSILINGTDIRGFDIKTLHRAVGVMFQEYARFAVSAAENIGYGCVENLADHSRICEAARRAKAYEFINRLPYEFDTVLSRLFRDGHELSLGQWQRICLARLFMKDPPIMIFDEPTASLDIETEVHLLNEIARLAQDRICVLVSHRMFRHDIAEQIVILKDGQVVEQGRYEDLVNRDGEFARLHRLYHGTAQNHAGENAEGTTATPILSH